MEATLKIRFEDKNSKIMVHFEYKGDISSEVRDFLDDVYDFTHIWAFETKKNFQYSLVFASQQDIVSIDNTDWQKEVNVYDIFVSAINKMKINTASLTPYEMEHLINDSINKLLCQK